MYDVTIIGGGIVGASLAYALSRYDLKVAVLERANDIASGATKANSAIIHAGYDPEPGTLMARLNVRGSYLAKEICEKLDVPYRQCGAFVIAFDDGDLKKVEFLYENGLKNKVPGLEILDRETVLSMEPGLTQEVKGALYAPTSAIVSPWTYALAMMENAVLNGVELHLQTEVLSIQKGEAFTIETTAGSFTSRYVVNAAGVQSADIHRMVGGDDFDIIPVRGQYYLLDRNEGWRVKRTIFSCPTDKGKSVLVSPTVHGNLIVGPNAEPMDDDENMSTTTAGLKFVRTLAVKSVPAINFRENIRNFSGARAQSTRPDFIVEESRAAKGFVNLAGIKSPGLSSSPAIAEEAVGILEGIGLKLEKKKHMVERRWRKRFAEMSADERNALIATDPRYGRLICRCETVTEGEIIETLHSPIPPVSIGGVKRRVNAGMGRCQGGFCGPRVLEIIARERGIAYPDVLQDGAGTYILTGETKGAKA